MLRQAVAVFLLAQCTPLNAEMLHINWLGNYNPEEATAHDIRALETDLDMISEDFERSAKKKNSGGGGGLEMVKKYEACLNSDIKKKTFCNGCCIFQMGTGKDADVGKGSCLLKECITENPCLVPSDYGLTDKLCYDYVHFNEAKDACKTVCKSSAQCGPQNVNSIQSKSCNGIGGPPKKSADFERKLDSVDKEVAALDTEEATHT